MTSWKNAMTAYLSLIVRCFRILYVNYYLPKHKAGDYQFHACAEDETGEGSQRGLHGCPYGTAGEDDFCEESSCNRTEDDSDRRDEHAQQQAYRRAPAGMFAAAAYLRHPARDNVVQHGDQYGDAEPDQQCCAAERISRCIKMTAKKHEQQSEPT